MKTYRHEIWVRDPGDIEQPAIFRCRTRLRSEGLSLEDALEGLLTGFLKAAILRPGLQVVIISRELAPPSNALNAATTADQ